MWLFRSYPLLICLPCIFFYSTENGKFMHAFESHAPTRGKMHRSCFRSISRTGTLCDSVLTFVYRCHLLLYSFAENANLLHASEPHASTARKDASIVLRVFFFTRICYASLGLPLCFFHFRECKLSARTPTTRISLTGACTLPTMYLFEEHVYFKRRLFWLSI